MVRSMSILKYTILAFFLLSLISCATPKQEFQTFEVGVVPIIINNGGDELTPEFMNKLDVSLLIAKLEIEKDVKVVLNFDEPLLVNEVMEMACPFEYPELKLNSQYKRNILLFINVPNECTNLLGCSGLESIKDTDPIPVLITAEDDQVATAMVLIHEMGHVLGAEHLNDMHIMTAAQQFTLFLDYSQKSLDQIWKVLSPLYKDK